MSLSSVELAFAEVELARRGQSASAGAYLGQRSHQSFGKRLYDRGGMSLSDNRTCSDFTSTLNAQMFFLRAGGPTADPHGLDRDGDGLACEWGTTLGRTVARNRQAAASPRRPSYSARCYTGPRGGTYTITSSGRRNYGGC